MSIGVLALALTAAFAHAGWNFLAKGAAGGAGFVWLSMVVATVVYLPVMGVALVVVCARPRARERHRPGAGDEHPHWRPTALALG
jgi:heme/copper-type cytochrome/quinol oxidase subunit 2